MVTSKQSPHLLLPLTSFGPQGHKIPAEIQPRISSDDCAVYRAICDSSGQNKIHSWIVPASDHQAPETDSTYTESLHGTDGQEKNLCDEARDYWENREGRWVRVHSIARRTLFDPIHDEQPLCHNLTERRRTAVRFLEQQNEMIIDDTWPQAGEMQSLWKGTTEFWTNDMPQDDTWRPNIHQSHILPLFRLHLTRDTAAMSPLRQNPVTSTEHECRDHHLPAVSHTENAEEEGRCVVLFCQNYTACTVTTTMTPLVPQNLDDKGEITETNKSIQRELVSEEEERRSSQKMEGHTELDLLQDDVN